MKVSEIEWKEEEQCGGENTLYIFRLEDKGRITVLDRLTGFGDGNIRDVETGYKDPEGKFWLASGHCDIRRYPELTLEEAVEWIKSNANNCMGV